MSDKEKNEEQKYIKLVELMPKVAIALFVGAFIFYSFNFGSSLSAKTDVWGQFGDFIGGVINPIIGIITIFILALAYKAQRDELRETRNELRLSRIEQANASRALSDQNEIAIKRAQISELMEAARHLHAELKVSLSETKVTCRDTLMRAGLETERISLAKALESSTLKDELPKKFEYSHNKAELLSLQNMFSQLSECYLTSLRLSEGAQNPLIESIIYHWIPAVVFLNSIGVKLDSKVLEAFQVKPNG